MPTGDTTRRARATRDLDQALDALYSVPPPDFIVRREELAAEAKSAGRPDDGRRIHAARRPTLAAWAANLLIREQPEASRQFLDLGRALREAHRTLDRAQLKELSAQQWRVVSALSRQAAALGQQAGHRLSEGVQRDIESTLRTVLADPEAAERWSTGRLDATLTPPTDLPPTDSPPSAQAAGRSSGSTSPQAPAPARPKDDLAARRRERREQLTQARQAAKAAKHQLDDGRARQTAAADGLSETRDRHGEAQRRVRDAEQQLRQARTDLQQCETAVQDWQTRLAAADAAVPDAETAFREATAAVERLSR